MLFGLASSALADDAVLLRTAQESAQARIELARNGDELYVGTYILGQDQAGLQMMAALRDAARRGVKVQIIADAYENQLSKGMVKHLLEDPASEGRLEFKIYHPLSIWPWRNLSRMHSKWMVAVDHQTGEVSAIFGGRNLWNKSFGLTKDADRDMDVLVRGKSARRALNYAKMLWKSGHVSNPTGLDSVLDIYRKLAAVFAPIRQPSWDLLTKDGGETWYPRTLSRVTKAEREWAHARLDEAELQLNENRFLKTDSPTHWRDKLKEVGHVQFLGDNPDVNRSTNLSVLKLLREAKHSLLIANAYSMLTPEMQAALKEARRRGVKMVFLTNSSHSNNVKLAQASYEMQVHEIIELGAAVFEYQLPYLIHEKFIVADGERNYVGSFNMDRRSQAWNLENGVIFESPEVAKQLKQIAHRQMRVSRRLRSANDLSEPRACDELFTYLGAQTFEDLL